MQNQEIQKIEHQLSIIEQVLMQGDLSKLDCEQRVLYYNKVCESIGLNPLTRPFEYISLKGKLTLYAKKDATEQIRSVRNISIVELEGKIVDDLYIVRAKALLSNGRMDQSTGAVAIGHLRGEDRANAIMKAETKAKRRVTLSIAGLNFIDESEIESIAHANFVNVDLKTGQIESVITDQKAITCEPEKKENKIKEVDTVEKFIDRNNIKSGEKIYDYVVYISKYKNLTVEETLNQAFIYQKEFLDAFKKYSESKQA